MTPDPIVEEVRAIRERLAAMFDFDIGRIIADARRRQASSSTRVISFQTGPSSAQQGAEPDREQAGELSPS
jgi:hypothetical protein